MRPQKRTTLFAWFFGSFLLGLGSVVITKNGLSNSWLLIILLLCLLLIRARALAWMIVMMIGLLLGLVRGGQFYPELQTYGELDGVSVTIRGVALQDATYHESGQLEFDLNDITVLSPAIGAVKGKIRIRSYTNLVLRGDTVEVSGKLYKSRGGVQARISYAETERVASNQHLIEEGRRSFSSGVRNTLAEPSVIWAGAFDWRTR